MTCVYPDGKVVEVGLTVDHTDRRIDAAVAAVGGEAGHRAMPQNGK